MEPEPPPPGNLPTVLVSRGSLYVIVAVMGLSVLGCVCALAYSLANYARLKQNAEEARRYIASRAKAADLQHSGSSWTGAAAHARSTTVKMALASETPAAGNNPGGLGARAPNKRRMAPGRTVNGTVSDVVAEQVAPGTERAGSALSSVGAASVVSANAMKHGLTKAA
ncbi:uncharacterized protein LOC144130332 [Amblyomma americanum]